jgi:hypothetical protein
MSARNNADLLGDALLVGMLLDVVEERIVRILELSRSTTYNSLDGLQAVLARVVDPVRVFVKTEPHKEAKALMKRWRLIWSCGLVDQVIERFLYTNVTKSEISRWLQCPSKPGMGSSDPDLAALAGMIADQMSYTGMLADTDVSGWDMSLKRWTLLVAEFSYYLQMPYSVSSDYIVLAMWRNNLACKPIAVTSNGDFFRIDSVALMLSGRFVTSWLNSRARVSLIALRGYTGMAMGDDCIEAVAKEDKQLLQFYQTLGYPSEVEYHESWINSNFCSLRFFLKDDMVQALPANWSRTLYRLLSKTVRPPEEVLQFLGDIRHVSRTPAEEAAVWDLVTPFAEALSARAEDV